jgi:acylphosphatase
MKHWMIRVHGKVQGVWFRKYSCEEALRLGLRGWVRNEPDGSVLIKAEGKEESLRELMRWCQQGPPLAAVTKVEVEALEMEGLKEFTILR